MSAEAQFCPTCGNPSRKLLNKTVKRIDQERKVADRATWAIAIVFSGTLLALVITALLFQDGGYTWSRLSCSVVLDVFIGLSAAACLGGNVALACLYLPCKNSDFGKAALAAIVTFAFASAYVGILNRVFESGDAAELFPADSRLVFAVSAIIVAPIIEEWLCRGIMWDAMRQVTSATATVLVTAMLFAFLHMLGGGFVFELPHRFVAGVLFGLLRLKTDSLWPGIFAHFLNNLAAVILMFA